MFKNIVDFGERIGKQGSAGHSHPTGEVPELQAPPGSSGDFLVAMRGRRQGVLTVPSVSAAPPSAAAGAVCDAHVGTRWRARGGVEGQGRSGGGETKRRQDSK